MLKNITMGGTGFRPDLNLQNLSMISIATKLWDSQNIKNRMKNNVRKQIGYFPDQNWYEISKLVVEHANSINLPASLSVLLKKAIVLIGQKIYDWIVYVTEILKLDWIFTQKIYFTFGVVDEIKIFDLYWRDLMAPDNFICESRYFKHSPLFSSACMYGCERFVKERKDEMMDELSQFYPEIKTGDEIYNIMSVSICMTERNKIPENVPLPQEMFEMCLEAGFSKAARFYWEKLDEIEKVSNLTNLAKKRFGNFYYTNYLREKDCENLLFLINEMGEKERYLFFADYADEIIRLFLPVWPYQELTADLLKYDWNIQSSRLLKMVDFIISFIGSSVPLKFPLDNELVLEIIRKAWGKIPVDGKFPFLRNTPERIPNLFSTLNPEILNLVLNDPSVRKVNSKKMDYLIKDGFVELVKMGEFGFLNTIIETVFNFIPEPKEILKEHCYDRCFVRELIEIDESFGLIDQFLDWSAESEEERARLKNKINTISVCRYLTELPYKCFKFELADKFLKWRLESDADVKNFKEDMKSYNFVIVESQEYVRIKSGDLSWLSPGDLLAMHSDEDPYDNADGMTFLKFEDATELNRGVVLGIKSFCPEEDYDALEPAVILDVDYVGTKVGDLIVFTILQIWSNRHDSYSSVKDIFGTCEAFVKFYYETDEEVLKFKKTKLSPLVTENPKEFLLEALKGKDFISPYFLDAFCDFCMIPSEEVEEIKIRERRDIEEILDTYLIDQLKFDFASIYLNFLFGNVEKREVSKKYLNSSNKAALLCVAYIKKHGEFSSFDDFDYMKLSIWLNVIDDMEKLKNDVLALNENTPEWFPALLDSSAHMYWNASV